MGTAALLVGDGDLSGIDLLLKFERASAVDSTADGVARAEHLLDGARQGLGHRAGSHHTRNTDDGVEGNISIMHHILHLLSISGGLLELLEDKSRRGGQHRHGSHTVYHTNK